MSKTGNVGCADSCSGIIYDHRTRAGLERGGGEMTNQEINEAVARKLGWKKHTKTCEVPTPGASIFTFGDHWYQAGMLCRERMPNYCTSISAAWEIVEHVRDRGYAWNISESNMGRGWSAYIWYPMTEEPSATSWDALNKIDTAPMAICLAFLKLP